MDSDVIQYASPRAPKKTSLSTLIGVVLGVLVVVGGAAFVVHGLAVGREAPLQPGDRGQVITATDFQETFDLELDIDPSLEKLKRQRYIDRSYDIEYEYETDSLYLTNSLTVQKSTKDAVAVYGTMALSVGLVLKAFGDGAEAVDAPDLFTGGDARKAGWITYDGQRGGAYVFAREGTKVFMFMLAGYNLADEELVALVQPRLDQLAKD